MIKEIKSIMSTIKEHQYEVFIVGGYVRDYLLNIRNEDYDLATNMPLEELKKIIPNLHIMKENHHRQASTIRIGNKTIEISTFKGDNIEEDLSNRDFTINALALDIDNKLIDPNNYKEDLNNRIIKLVKKDGSGLDYDPLRILRAIRFSLSHNFTISNNTKEKILEKKELLKTVTKERINNELLKILSYKEATRYIDEYRELFFIIIPRLKETYNFDQHNNYHIYDVFHHTLKVIDGVSNNKYLKLAALFHDIGKPEKFFTDEEGIGHFYGHWETSAKIFNQYCKEYKVDKKTKDIVTSLIINHDRQLPSKRSNMIKFLQRFNPEYLNLLFELKKADILAQNPIYQEQSLSKLQDEINRYTSLINEEPVLHEKDLAINGEDLISLGYKGKEIGEIKKQLLNAVTNNKLKNNKKNIIEYLKERCE